METVIIIRPNGWYDEISKSTSQPGDRKLSLPFQIPVCATEKRTSSNLISQPSSYERYLKYLQFVKWKVGRKSRIQPEVSFWKRYQWISLYAKSTVVAFGFVFIFSRYAKYSIRVFCLKNGFHNFHIGLRTRET